MPMTNPFTPNDLLRFIYRETTPEEDCGIKQWILEDAIAASLFQDLSEAKNSLDIDHLKPSETSVNIILDFSKECTHEETHA